MTQYESGPSELPYVDHSLAVGYSDSGAAEHLGSGATVRGPGSGEAGVGRPNLLARAGTGTGLVKL